MSSLTCPSHLFPAGIFAKTRAASRRSHERRVRDGNAAPVMSSAHGFGHTTTTKTPRSLRLSTPTYGGAQFHREYRAIPVSQGDIPQAIPIDQSVPDWHLDGPYDASHPVIFPPGWRHHSPAGMFQSGVPMYAQVPAGGSVPRNSDRSADPASTTQGWLSLDAFPAVAGDPQPGRRDAPLPDVGGSVFPPGWQHHSPA